LGILQSNLMRVIGPWVVSRLVCPINRDGRGSDELGDRKQSPKPKVAMELTAELFRKVVESPEPVADIRAEREHRRTPRTRLKLHATLMPFSEQFGSDNVIAPVRDLSRGGFSFLSDRHLPLGEQFAMLLRENASGRPIVVLCTVAYWQPLDEQLFTIGARFCRVLRQGELGLPMILEDAASGELSEQRMAS
jgi:hypothetical protein